MTTMLQSTPDLLLHAVPQGQISHGTKQATAVHLQPAKTHPFAAPPAVPQGQFSHRPKTATAVHLQTATTYPFAAPRRTPDVPQGQFSHGTKKATAVHLQPAKTDPCAAPPVHVLHPEPVHDGVQRPDRGDGG